MAQGTPHGDTPDLTDLADSAWLDVLQAVDRPRLQEASRSLGRMLCPSESGACFRLGLPLETPE